MSCPSFDSRSRLTPILPSSEMKFRFTITIIFEKNEEAVCRRHPPRQLENPFHAMSKNQLGYKGFSRWRHKCQNMSLLWSVYFKTSGISPAKVDLHFWTEGVKSRSVGISHVYFGFAPKLGQMMKMLINTFSRSLSTPSHEGWGLFHYAKEEYNNCMLHLYEVGL